MKYGLQLYSVRDAAAENFEGMLAQVAEMGYELVEPAGFFGLAAEEVRAMLDHYGLEVCSTHTGARDLFGKFEQTLEYHKKIGCKNIILPSAPFTIKEDIDYSVACINRFQPILEAEGIKLHYHNHSLEFLPNKDGLIFEEELAKRTKIGFEIDTFWAFNAGVEVFNVLEKYGDRIEFIHLKDGFAHTDPDHIHNAEGKSLGQGETPIAEIRKLAIQKGWTMVVESEGLDPTGPQEAKRCIDYLRTLDAADMH